MTTACSTPAPVIGCSRATNTIDVSTSSAIAE
jgi:hypothetical protein